MCVAVLPFPSFFLVRVFPATFLQSATVQKLPLPSSSSSSSSLHSSCFSLLVHRHRDLLPSPGGWTSEGVGVCVCVCLCHNMSPLTCTGDSLAATWTASCLVQFPVEAPLSPPFFSSVCALFLVFIICVCMCMCMCMCLCVCVRHWGRPTTSGSGW